MPIVTTPANEKIEANIANLAASYQEAILKSLFKQLDLVIKITGIETVSIVGGVAANKRFREMANTLKNDSMIEIYFPKFEYCTDNAAMIAMAGYLKYKNNKSSNIDIEPNPNIVYK